MRKAKNIIVDLNTLIWVILNLDPAQAVLQSLLILILTLDPLWIMSTIIPAILQEKVTARSMNMVMVTPILMENR